MDNISDYIPLLIIVVSIIVSVIKGAGKKTREETAKTMLPGRKVVSQERKVSSRNSKQNEISVPQAKPIRKESLKTSAATLSSKIASQNEASLTNEVLMDEPECETFSFDFENMEEVRRAVVYSEILNRKFS